MSEDAKEKLFRECLYGGFTIYGVIELVRGLRDAWSAGSKVFASIPNDVLAAYPQLNDMLYKGVIPLLQKNTQPQEFEKEFEKFTQFMTTYHDQIVIFTPLGAAILVGLAVFLYQLALLLPFWGMGIAAAEKSIEGFLVASAFAVAMYWPSALITILVLCAIGYVVFLAIPLIENSTRRT